MLFELIQPLGTGCDESLAALKSLTDFRNAGIIT